MTRTHFLLLLGVCFVWGLNTVIVKAVLGDIPPLLFTALRFMVLCLVLVPFLKPQPGQMKTLIGIGLTAGCIHFALIFSGLAVANASVVNIVLQMSIPLMTLLSVLVLGERLGWRRWSAIGLAMLGVLVLSFDPSVFQAVLGVILILGAALSYAFASILMKRTPPIPIFQMQAWIAFVSMPPLVALTLVFEPGSFAALPEAPWTVFAAVLFTALGATLYGHAVFYYLIQRYDVGVLWPQTLMAPVIGVLLSVVFLGEALTWRIILGAVLIFTAVLIIARRQGARERAGEGEGPTPGTLKEGTAHGS